MQRKEGEAAPKIEQLSYREYAAMVRNSASVGELWARSPKTIVVAGNQSTVWPQAARDASAAILRLSNIGSGGSSASAMHTLTLASLAADFPGMEKAWSSKKHYTNGKSFYECVPTGWNGITVPYFDPEELGNDRIAAEYPVKLLRRLFWRKSCSPLPTKTKTETKAMGETALLAVASGDFPNHNPPSTAPPQFVVGVYFFSHLTQGPPKRAHGGSVLTCCDDIHGQLVLREVGFLPTSNTTELTVEYLGATPLSKPVVVVARLIEQVGREIRTEAIAFNSKDFFNISRTPFQDCFQSCQYRPCFRSTSVWKQAKPSKLGMDRPQTYDETLANFRKAIPPPASSNQWDDARQTSKL